MNESRPSFVELVVGEVPDKGSVHSLGSLIFGGLGGGYLGYEAGMFTQEQTSVVVVAREPITDFEITPEMVGTIGGAVLGAAVVYTGIRKWAIGRVGLSTYKKYKEG